MNVYLAINREPHGPFTTEQLDAMWRSGSIPAGALYWYEGMTAWNAVEQFQSPSTTAAAVSPTSVIITTSPVVANREIEIERDIVTAECVFGMHILRDMAAALSDVFDGRNESTQELLRKARKTCLRELRKEAAALGADAVIGVDLDYSEISGQGRTCC